MLAGGARHWTVLLAAWLERPAGWPAIAASLLAAFLAVVAPIVLAPNLYVGTMAHDSLSMADIGYRMAQGQIPGRDFHSAFGVAFQWQMGLAWRLTGTAAGALKAATWLFFLVAAAGGAYIARTRLSNLSAIALLIAVVVLGCTPYARATPENGGATYAMVYNREGWVLLLLALLFWPEPRRPVRLWAEALVLGLLTAACVYVKLSYGAMAIAFLCLLAIAQPGARKVAFGAVVVLGLCAALLELIYRPGFNLAYLADIVAVARAGDARLVHIAVNLYLARAELLAACLVVPLLAVGWGRRARPQDLAFVGFCAAAGLLIIWQNAQVEGIVTLWAGVAVVLDRRREPQPADAGRNGFGGTLAAAGAYAAFGALTLLPMMPTLLEAVLGGWGRSPTPFPSAPVLAGLRFPNPPPERRLRNAGVVYGDEYARTVEDGLALLAACPKGRALATLDMFDPFTEAQGRTPNRGWSWRHFGHSFSMRTYPDPAQEFRGVDCVMIPSNPTNPETGRALLTVYGPYLDGHFSAVRRSPGWTLRLRTAP